ncbi:hypothetical protein HDU76_008922 [Blyttiomyces sp. JEL0837]|nr:hypothetical protein HDU76_008922 [Blyttiomyces sp. JEL0837]
MKRSNDSSLAPRDSLKRVRVGGNYNSGQNAAAAGSAQMQAYLGGADMYSAQFANMAAMGAMNGLGAAAGMMDQATAAAYMGHTFGGGVGNPYGQYGQQAGGMGGGGMGAGMGGSGMYTGQGQAGFGNPAQFNAMNQFNAAMASQFQNAGAGGVAQNPQNPASALNFFADAQAKRLVINNQEVKLGWGKPSQCPPTIMAAVQNGASRNVYIGSLDDTMTEHVLNHELSKYGIIDQIKILLEKKIAFVHLNSVAAAMKAVNALPAEPLFVGKRVNYGKDRCGGAIPGNQHNVGANLMQAGGGVAAGVGGGMPFDAFYGQGAMNRTVYLGGVHAEAVTKDICDVVRGGILQQVKYMAEKNIAFVTFIDPSAAMALYHRGNNEGVVIKGKRVKVGWGKPSTIPMSVATAIQTGASRNVYIGSIDASVNEERLRRDLNEYGEIEMVNLVPDKNIAFVSFTDILSAVKAVEGMKANPEYASYKVSFGKDRCGNPPRPPGMRNANAGGGAGAAGVGVGDMGAPLMAPGTGVAGMMGMEGDGFGMY